MLEIIRRGSGGWHLYSHEGKHLGGPYKTKKKAQERERQVNYWKHKKE